jgi:hypothetical protein
VSSPNGGDANDEFARWLAETARAEQAAAPDPAQPQQPAAPPPAAAPAAAPPAAPEFFGADQLAAPPTRPYEPQPSGPPVARSSYQPPAEQPAAEQPPAAPPSSDYVTPAVLPPAAGDPGWAPQYTSPPAPEAPTPQPSEQPANPFFPDQQAAPAPSWDTAPAPGAGVPAFEAPAYVPPATPPAEPVASPAEPAAPAWSPYDAPAQTAPETPAFDPAQPTAAFPAAPAAPAPSWDAPAVPPADPFGALFATNADDTAARLAASPPPSADAPIASPPASSVPADEDPMKSLFGLETEEHPAIRPDAPAPEPSGFGFDAPAAAPEPPADQFAAAQPPAFTPEPSAPLPTYTPEPASTSAPYTPEPSFAAAPSAAPVPEPAFAAAAAPASGASSYSLSQSGGVPADDDPSAGTQFFGGGAGEWDDSPDLDKTTTVEKIGLGLAILLPPIGLIAGIVNAVRSSRERGWVHRLIRISLGVAVVMTVVAGIGGAYLYKAIDDARKHDAIAAASAQFCKAVTDDPSMISPPAFGFPAPGATIADTITSFQAYVDKWTALAGVSPSGIRADVNRVVDSAQGIVDTVTKSRLVDNDQNIEVMSSVAGSTNIVGWADEYCG